VTSDSADQPADPVQDLLAAFPGVRIDPDNSAHYQGLLERRLLINRCADCSTWHHPPRPVCPECWSSTVEAHEVAGSGTVALLTILRQGPRQPGVDYRQGHVLVAVELDEQPGLRVSGTVVGLAADQVRLGDRVGLVWTDIDGRAPRPDFEVIR
jgi:uncharacterized OB-fold protein